MITFKHTTYFTYFLIPLVESRDFYLFCLSSVLPALGTYVGSGILKAIQTGWCIEPGRVTVGSGTGKRSEGQIIMRLVNWVKIFGLNPEGNGILSGHLSVTVEFQETHSGCTVAEGLETGKAECRWQDERCWCPALGEDLAWAGWEVLVFHRQWPDYLCLS